MTLDELTTLLGKVDPELVLPNGFTNPHSYRGYYDELAFEPAENVTVGSMLSAVWSADGETFTGYKGGEYTMTSDTTCWIAHEGSAGGEEITPELLAGLLTAGSRSTPMTPDRGLAPWGRDPGGRPLLPAGAHWTDVPELVEQHLAGIRARVTEAQPGTWFVPPAAGVPGTVCTQYDGYTRTVGQFTNMLPGDLELTLHAHSDLNWSLDLITKLRARVAELESATGTARAMHRKHPDSEHCQYDDMTWPCPTVTVLDSPATDLAAAADAMSSPPMPARAPDPSPWEQAVAGLNALADAKIAFSIEPDGHIANPFGDEHIEWDQAASRWRLVHDDEDDVHPSHPAPCRVPDSPDCTCPNEHPMDRAMRLGATRVPEDLAIELCEATNTGRPTGWPEMADRDGEIWAVTEETYDGDTVLMPCASDMRPMLRRDVERHFGPLAVEGTS